MPGSIHPDCVLAALAKASGNQFEAFFKEFMAAIRGEDFIPLGGMHDGGADAFTGERVFSGAKTGTFYQASVQADYRAKIKGTVKRLKGFGREPRTLVYVTSRIIEVVDVVEEELTTTLDVIIRIRDGSWISNNINRDEQTKAAYHNHLHRLLELPFGATDRHSLALEGGDNIQACVFLSYEVDSQAGKSNFIQAVTDSLVIWALEETDPDQSRGKLMSEKEISKKILDTFPFAKQFLHANLGARLKVLSSKGNAAGREVRAYKKQGVYCLPHEAREEIKEEHIKIDALLYRVKEQLKEGLLPQIESAEASLDPDKVVDIIMSALEAVFRNEGIKVGLIASGQDDAPELTAISDYVDEQILRSDLEPDAAITARQICISGMRSLFYDSTDDQRLFLQTLSRTYSFLFSMKYEPRIVEYFQRMKSKFHLYVGSDIIVRALSETFLPVADRATENMLKILREAGSTLVLTEPALDEVWTHIISTDTEFSAEFSAIENKIDLTIASQAQRILIRSYFYTKLAPSDSSTKIKGWTTYLDQFCNYRSLRTSEGKDSLREYLCRKYGLEFEDFDFMLEQVDLDKLDEITKRFLPMKKKEVMAKADALIVLFVYARRRANRERYSGNPYGFATWWLTQESRIQSVISDLVKANGGRCIIRPEFLMYYISMLPKRQEVNSLYRETFPSLYGVKLGRRVRPELLADVLERARQYMAYDEARVSAELKAFADKLKADQVRDYSLKRHPMETA